MSTIPALESAAVGAPLTRAGISLIPVYLHGDRPPDISADTSAVSVTEVAQASVPTLHITNSSHLPTLITEGEVLSGGQQDRVVNTSVLVPANANLELPVSCVEHGRWGGGQGFGRSARYASRRVRRATNWSVTNNQSQAPDNNTDRRSDQSLVWSTVAHELGRLDAHSNTGSFLATSEALRADRHVAAAVNEVTGHGPLPGQRGVVVAHGGRIVSLDLFASTDLLAAHWEGLVGAWFLDASEVADDRRPGLSAALRFVRRLGTTNGDVSAGVGIGREVRIRTRRFCAQALLADDAVVHASAFTIAV
jgi:hypothetical protein